MENSEKLTTLCTQDEEKQNKNTTQYKTCMCWTPLYVNKHKQRKDMRRPTTNVKT